VRRPSPRFHQLLHADDLLVDDGRGDQLLQETPRVADREDSAPERAAHVFGEGVYVPRLLAPLVAAYSCARVEEMSHRLAEELSGPLLAVQDVGEGSSAALWLVRRIALASSSRSPDRGVALEDEQWTDGVLGRGNGREVTY